MATETTTTPAKTEKTETTPSPTKKILMWALGLVSLAIVIWVISRAWKKGQA